MRTFLVVKLTLISLFAVLTGCATNRSEIKLGEPADAAKTPVAVKKNGQTVFIRNVVDERIFEEKPVRPSIPSLGFEGSAKSTEEVKSRAVARKRNGFGQAIGDVLLENGQTVTSVVRSNLSLALEQAGYTVAPAAPAGSAIPVDVRIKRFWTWLTPGFLAVTISSQIATDLSVGDAKNPTVVNISYEELYAAATDGTWIEAINKALARYRTEVGTKLSDTAK